MISESALRDVLISLAKWAKECARTDAQLLVEIGVLRETVRALDPTFSENFAFRKEEMLSRTASESAALLAGLDQIIEKLESGYVC